MKRKFLYTPLVLFVSLSVAFISCSTKTYMGRWMKWRGSDILDYEKFHRIPFPVSPTAEIINSLISFPVRVTLPVFIHFFRTENNNFADGKGIRQCGFLEKYFCADSRKYRFHINTNTAFGIFILPQKSMQHETIFMHSNVKYKHFK